MNAHSSPAACVSCHVAFPPSPLRSPVACAAPIQVKRCSKPRRNACPTRSRIWGFATRRALACCARGRARPRPVSRKLFLLREHDLLTPGACSCFFPTAASSTAVAPYRSPLHPFKRTVFDPGSRPHYFLPHPHPALADPRGLCRQQQIEP